MKSLIFWSLLLLSSLNLSAQNSPTGVWKTIDDNTGEAKSHVEIYEQDGQYYGKIVKVLQVDPSKTCDKCPGSKKGRPIVGLVIMEELKPHKGFWRKGSILDPENGNEYGCSIWLEEGNADVLRVRGKHWTGFYRTQTWYRVE